MSAPLGRLAGALGALFLLAASSCAGPPAPGAGAKDAILLPAPPPPAGVTASTFPAGGLAPLVVLTRTPGPAAAGRTVRASAPCPAGTVVVGGGAVAELSSGAMASPSLHINGTMPLAAMRGSGWAGVGATGGQIVLGGVTTGVALCAPIPAASLQVVQASEAGPGAARGTATATATCPAGTRLLGGGGWADAPGSSPSLHLLGTFPSGMDGTPPAPGPAPGSWSAVADSGGRSAAGVQTSAYALCAAAGAGLGEIDVAVATASGPAQPATARSATAACPQGSLLIGGGVDAGLPGGRAPQQGIHLTGSFPSTPGGQMVTTQSAGSWTGRAESGGQSAPGTATTAFALCARP